MPALASALLAYALRSARTLVLGAALGWTAAARRGTVSVLGWGAGQEVVGEGAEFVDGGVDLAGEIAFDRAGAGR